MLKTICRKALGEPLHFVLVQMAHHAYPFTFHGVVCTCLKGFGYWIILLQFYTFVSPEVCLHFYLTFRPEKNTFLLKFEKKFVVFAFSPECHFSILPGSPYTKGRLCAPIFPNINILEYLNALICVSSLSESGRKSICYYFLMRC